jgi:hypothetical protein
MCCCVLLFTLGFTTRRFVWSWEFGGEGKKQVDVVISDINHSLLGDQVKIIDAIKEAGNVKVGNLIWVNELLTWLMFCHSGFILDWDLIVFL